MIKGLYISDAGEVQIVGEVSNLSGIIRAMEQVLPQLREQNRKLVAEQFGEHELMQMLTEKKAAEKAAKEKTEGKEEGGAAAKTA